jgi:hypothetical protein
MQYTSAIPELVDRHKVDLIGLSDRVWATWTAPTEWSKLIVSASSASGPLERGLQAPAGGIPTSCVA